MLVFSYYIFEVLSKPETFLGFSILIQFILNLNANEGTSLTKKYLPGGLYERYFIQTLIILFLTLVLIFYDTNYASSSSLLFVSNTFHTRAIKGFIILFSISALPAITQGLLLQRIVAFEFYTFFLFSVLSSLLMVSALDFLTFFLLLEMQALCFYVLAAFKKDSIFSIEAAIKYFLLNSIISCVLLFSLSILYGLLGTLNFSHISMLLISYPFQDSFGSIDFLIFFCFLLIVLVIFFKLGVAPFHFWVPDVYEGAPLSSTLIFSFLPKIVFFDLLIKFCFVFGEVFTYASVFFLTAGVFTVLVGSFFAIAQEKLKRFLIYSSISQIGFPITLLSLDVTNPSVQSSIYFFILVYTISSIVVWSLYIFLYQYTNKINIDETVVDTELSSIYLGDLSRLNLDPYLLFVSCFVFFSFSGVPPLFGFLIKFIVINELIINDYMLAAIVLIFLSSVSLFFYIRIIKGISIDKKNVPVFPFVFSSSTNNMKFLYFTGFVLCCYTFFLGHAFLYLDTWLYITQFLFFSN